MSLRVHSKVQDKSSFRSFKRDFYLVRVAQKYELAPTHIRTWKKQFSEGAEDIFEKPSSKKTEEEQEKNKLLQTIGTLKVENDFLKKNIKIKPLAEKRQQLDPKHPNLSVRQQCKLIGIHCSGLYYQPKQESPLNMELMRLMDEHYLKHPYKGARAMHLWLTADKGFEVNCKCINRLYYSVMGLRSILPDPQTSKPGKGEEHQVFPYLLRG